MNEVTISIDEFKELIRCKTILDSINEYFESSEYKSCDDIRVLIGKYEKKCH